MSQCTVHENPGASRGAAPLLLDVQADLLSDLATRVVVPLIPLADFGRPVARLHPTFMVSGAAHVMATHLIAAIPRAALGAEIASLADQRDQVVAAIDVVLSGV